MEGGDGGGGCILIFQFEFAEEVGARVEVVFSSLSLEERAHLTQLHGPDVREGPLDLVADEEDVLEGVVGSTRWSISIC